MVLGGFFGSSSSSTPSPSSSASSDDTSPPFPQSDSTPTPLSSTGNSPTLTRLQSSLTQQNNIENAKFLISKVNETCFDHCVTSPGTSLSSKENGCLSACMEKYIESWNVVSRSYVGRLQKEGAQMGAGAGQGTRTF